MDRLIQFWMPKWPSSKRLINLASRYNLPESYTLRLLFVTPYHSHDNEGRKLGLEELLVYTSTGWVRTLIYLVNFCVWEKLQGNLLLQEEGNVIYLAYLSPGNLIMDLCLSGVHKTPSIYRKRGGKKQLNGSPYLSSNFTRIQTWTTVIIKEIE